MDCSLCWDQGSAYDPPEGKRRQNEEELLPAGRSGPQSGRYIELGLLLDLSAHYINQILPQICTLFITVILFSNDLYLHITF